jgi:phosphoserine phosphatase
LIFTQDDFTGYFAMDNVLTLVCSTTSELSNQRVDKICENLAIFGAEIGTPIWLSDNQACDIPFSSLSIEEADKIVRDNLASAPIDILSQSQKNRRKKLLIADMDSTIIQGETLDDMAKLAGIGPQIAKITLRAMNGEILFSDALRERVAMFSGLNSSLLSQVANSLILNSGAETLVRTMAAQGAYTALVSGGFRYFTELVAQRVGFDFNKGNEIEIVNNSFSGKIVEPISTKTTKKEILEILAQKKKIRMIETLAVGDGANDLPMLHAAGLGVAYHAKPVVVAQACARFEHTDLTTLLYYQGYKLSEFIHQ